MSGASWQSGIVDWMSMPIMVWVVGILAWRRLYREFPFFFACLVATVTLGILRLAAQMHSRTVYFYVYWISDLMIGILNVLAVYELFALRLFPGFYRIRFYKYFFGGVVAVIIFGFWLAAYESSNRNAALMLQSRALDFGVVVGLLSLLGLTSLMGRNWTKYMFGIASGFVIGNVGTLVSGAVWTRTHWPPSILNELPPIACDIASLIWLCSFWSPEAIARPEDSLLTPEVLDQARTWQAALKDWLTSGRRTP